MQITFTDAASPMLKRLEATAQNQPSALRATKFPVPWAKAKAGAPAADLHPDAADGAIIVDIIAEHLRRAIGGAA